MSVYYVYLLLVSYLYGKTDLLISGLDMQCRWVEWGPPLLKMYSLMVTCYVMLHPVHTL